MSLEVAPISTIQNEVITSASDIPTPIVTTTPPVTQQNNNNDDDDD